MTYHYIGTLGQREKEAYMIRDSGCPSTIFTSGQIGTLGQKPPAKRIKTLFLIHHGMGTLKKDVDRIPHW